MSSNTRFRFLVVAIAMHTITFMILISLFAFTPHSGNASGNLQLHYNFSGVKPGTFAVPDLSGNEHHATLMNGAHIKNTGKHRILELGKNNAYLDMGSITGELIASLNDFTLSVLLYIYPSTNLDAAGNFIATFANAENIADFPKGNMFLGARTTRLAVVPTNSSRTLYVDGKAYTEQGTYSACDFSAGTLYLGWDSALPGRSFKGEIDEVPVWNTERNATELENANKEVLSGEENGLLAYWNFDDAADEKVSDLSETQHGIIHGGSYVQSSLYKEMEENPSQYIAHQKLPVETLSNSASTSVEGANFASFQQNAITTYNGYQYVSYWNQVSQVCIARVKKKSSRGCCRWMKNRLSYIRSSAKFFRVLQR